MRAKAFWLWKPYRIRMKGPVQIKAGAVCFRVLGIERAEQGESGSQLAYPALQILMNQGRYVVGVGQMVCWT